MTPLFEMHNIEKKFGGFTALSFHSLQFNENTYAVVLGPSGSGKTTLLRIAAGLEVPDKGTVVIGGQDVTDLPSWKRNIGLVFQNYALYPHLTVYDNIAMPLTVQRFKNEYIRSKVGNLLKVMELESHEGKLPKQLSGGQQQRVALARALVKSPKILLMDEPLSNLDARVRIDLRDYLKETQRNLGITAIHVTHDQEEAMALGDNIVILNDSRIVQSGPPSEIYHKPANHFVASFLGGLNLIPAEMLSNMHLNQDFDTLGVRIEDVSISSDISGPGLTGTINNIQFLGYSYLVTIDMNGIRVRSKLQTVDSTGIGSRVSISFDRSKVLLFKGNNRIDSDFVRKKTTV